MMIRRPALGLAVASVALAAGLAACDGASPSASHVQVNVAPLELSGIVEACYDLRVTNGAAGAGDTVWSQTGICSTRYGDGSGALSYVAPCDAGAAGPNTVIVQIASLLDSSGPAAFANPCSATAPCQRDVACLEGTDTPVTFNLTIARPARQGFFDVAVSFRDVFCSAKVDCVTATAAGDAPLELLQAPGSSARVPSVVLAVACTGGTDAATELYFSDVELTCGGVALKLPISGAAGNAYTATSPAPSPLLQLARYRGREQLTDGAGASYAKLYANLAFAVDFTAVTAACSLTATATASDGPLTPPFVTPADTAYPLLRVDLPVVASANATAYACTRHPLGDAPGGGVWTAYTPLSVPVAFEHRVYVQAGSVLVADRVPLAIAPVSAALGPGDTQAFSATAGVPPYTFSLLSGAGSLVGAVYTAPAGATTAVVRVTDALGATSDATVSVTVSFATLDPLHKSAGVVLSADLLTASHLYGMPDLALATVGESSGKWYWEVTYVGQIGGTLPVHCYLEAGVTASLGATSRWYYESYFYGNPETTCRNYGVDGTIGTNYAGVGVSVGGTVGLRLDLGAGTLSVSVNGGAPRLIGSGITGVVFPYVGNAGYGAYLTVRANFGGDLASTPFVYPVPSGFNAGFY